MTPFLLPHFITEKSKRKTESEKLRPKNNVGFLYLSCKLSLSKVREKNSSKCKRVAVFTAENQRQIPWLLHSQQFSVQLYLLYSVWAG